MGEKPTAIEDAESGSRASNLNLSKSNINREAGGAGDDPAGIAVSDPGVPADKPKSK